MLVNAWQTPRLGQHRLLPLGPALGHEYPKGGTVGSSEDDLASFPSPIPKRGQVLGAILDLDARVVDANVAQSDRLPKHIDGEIPLLDDVRMSLHERVLELVPFIEGTIQGGPMRGNERVEG